MNPARYLLVRPTAVSLQYLIDLSQFVSARIEPVLVKEDIFSDKPQAGPGGGKAKRRKIGEKTVPCPAGRVCITIVTTNEIYRILYAKDMLDKANELNFQIARVVVSEKGGVASDVPSPDVAVDLSEPKEELEELEEQTTDEQNIQYDIPQNKFDEEGFEREPEYVERVFECSNCGNIYSFETSDPFLQINCTNEKCEQSNAPTCTAEELDVETRSLVNSEKKNSKQALEQKIAEQQLKNSHSSDEDVDPLS